MNDYDNRRISERIDVLKPTWIELKGVSLRVKDISNEGIGIILDDDSPRFYMGERIEKVSLGLSEGVVNLKGLVTHMSKTAAHTVCGIRFEYSGSDEYESVARFRREIEQDAPELNDPP